MSKENEGYLKEQKQQKNKARDLKDATKEESEGHTTADSGG